MMMMMMMMFKLYLCTVISKVQRLCLKSHVFLCNLKEDEDDNEEDASKAGIDDLKEKAAKISQTRVTYLSISLHKSYVCTAG